LELKDRIAELCNRAITEKDPVALNSVLKELKSALSEYIEAARRMTILHFDYFAKHQSFSAPPPLKTNGVQDRNVKDVKDDVKEENAKADDVKREAS